MIPRVSKRPITKEAVVGLETTSGHVATLTMLHPKRREAVPCVIGKNYILAISTSLTIEAGNAILTVTNLRDLFTGLIVKIRIVREVCAQGILPLLRKAHLNGIRAEISLFETPVPFLLPHLNISYVVAILSLTKALTKKTVVATNTVPTEKAIIAISAVLQISAAINIAAIKAVVAKLRMIDTATDQEIFTVGTTSAVTTISQALTGKT